MWCIAAVSRYGPQMSEAQGAAIARVRFEDSRTNVPALIIATTNAGYPAKMMQ